MINRVERPCASCGLLYILDSSGLCECCDPEKFKAERRGRKEGEIRNVLNADPEIPKFVCDRVIDHGVCGKERPDILFDATTHHVVVEVDEYQHQSYKSCDELKRMFNLANVALPCFFIRYNPDNYKPAKGTRKVSTKRKREDVLKTVVKSALKAPPENLEDDLCRVKYLFYDGYDHTKVAPVKRVKYDKETDRAVEI